MCCVSIKKVDGELQNVLELFNKLTDAKRSSERISQTSSSSSSDTLLTGVLFFTGVSNVNDFLPLERLVNLLGDGLLGDIIDSSSGVIRHLTGGCAACAGVALNGVEISFAGVPSMEDRSFLLKLLIGVSGSFPDNSTGVETSFVSDTQSTLVNPFNS